VTVTPVADVPSLTAHDAKGNQDTAIPLDITAALTDTDGSESLKLEIADLPPGAVLSAGTLVAPGRYALKPSQLAGLKFTPPSGLPGAFTLTVTATSTEAADGSTATATAHPTVTVDSVTANPLTLKGFVVNKGEAQRSLVHTLQVQFNQDVWIS